VQSESRRNACDRAWAGVIGGYRQGGRTSSVSYSARFTANLTALYHAATAGSWCPEYSARDGHTDLGRDRHRAATWAYLVGLDHWLSAN
jgi:hypothetical protein